MADDFNTYLEILKPYVASELVGEGYFNRFKEFASTIPVLSFGTFECRLGADDARVDVDMSVNSLIGEHKRLLKFASKSPNTENEDDKTARLRIAHICENWPAPTDFLFPYLRMLWLVYDVPDIKSNLPAPWNYIHFKTDAGNGDVKLKTKIILESLNLLKHNYNALISYKIHF